MKIRGLLPLRSPMPSPLLSLKDLGYTWYRTAVFHQGRSPSAMTAKPQLTANTPHSHCMLARTGKPAVNPRYIPATCQRRDWSADLGFTRSLLYVAKALRFSCLQIFATFVNNGFTTFSL